MGGYGFLRKIALIQLYCHCLASIVKANLEGDVLFIFKQQLNDPNGFLSSWDKDLVDPCTWLYITCDSDNNVIRIDLINMGLSGQLVPFELGNLVNLASIDLSHNSLIGDIPTTLGNLKNLKFLRLDHNGLTGEIPVQLTYISTLFILDLSYNNLAGAIPKFTSTVVTHFQGNPHLIQ